MPSLVLIEWISLVAQMVKHLPTMSETRVQSLGQEDLLQKEMATHSSILAWKIPWMEEPDRLQSWGRKESDKTEQLHFHFLSLRKPRGNNSTHHCNGKNKILRNIST